MKIRSKAFLFFLLFVICFGGLTIASASTQEQQAQFVSPKLVVNTSFLNVRTGPGIQYSVLLTVVGGTELPVIGRSNDGVWYQVATVIGAGWVNVEFTAPRGNFTNVPIVTLEDVIANFAATTPSTISTSSDQGGGAVISNSAPSVGSPIRFILQNGRTVTVSPGERFRAVINVEAVNLRTQPVDGAPTLGTLFRDVTFDYTIVGSASDKQNIPWVALDVPDLGVGWVEAPKLILRLSRVSGDVIVITESATAMRGSPGGGGENLPVLSQGQEGFILDISPDGQFVKIELGDGTQGWVPFNRTMGRIGTPTDEIDLSQISNIATTSTLGQGGGGESLITTKQTSFGLDTPHIVVNTGFLNIRSGPGAQFSILATLPGGAKLPVLGIASDNVWYLVEGSWGQGWVNSEFVVFRGSYQAVPIINIGR